MRGQYDRDNPPKGGAPYRLWRWWIKVFGEPPDELVSIYPDQTDLALGCARYKFYIGEDFFNREMFLVWNVAATVTMTKEDVEYRRSRSHEYREVWLC